MNRYRVERVFTDDRRFVGFFNHPTHAAAIKHLRLLAKEFSRFPDEASYLMLFLDRELITTLDLHWLR